MSLHTERFVQIWAFSKWPEVTPVPSTPQLNAKLRQAAASSHSPAHARPSSHLLSDPGEHGTDLRMDKRRKWHKLRSGTSIPQLENNTEWMLSGCLQMLQGWRLMWRKRTAVGLTPSHGTQWITQSQSLTHTNAYTLVLLSLTMLNSNNSHNNKVTCIVLWFCIWKLCWNTVPKHLQLSKLFMNYQTA